MVTTGLNVDDVDSNGKAMLGPRPLGRRALSFCEELSSALLCGGNRSIYSWPVRPILLRYTLALFEQCAP